MYYECTTKIHDTDLLVQRLMSELIQKDLVTQIENKMPWVNGIESYEQYKQLVELVGVLVENPDDNQTMINLLFPVIEDYEKHAPRFEGFNKAVDSMEASKAMLVVIMDQHQLKQSDFPEIGSKSYISRILNGDRSLSVKHIKMLSERFNVSPELFF